MNKILMDEVDVNRIVHRAMRASEPYKGCQDGSYEASLYATICEEMEVIRERLRASKSIADALLNS